MRRLGEAASEIVFERAQLHRLGQPYAWQGGRHGKGSFYMGKKFSAAYAGMSDNQQGLTQCGHREEPPDRLAFAKNVEQRRSTRAGQGKRQRMQGAKVGENIDVGEGPPPQR